MGKKKKTNLVILAVLGVLVLCGPVWAFSGSGSGIETDPYVITDVSELQEMRDDLSAYYVLGNDIDASETSGWNGGAGFEPIGDGINFFTGVLDGQNYSINNLYIDGINDSLQGLFGTLVSAIVKNVHLSDATVKCNYCGGTLAGRAADGSIVTNCSATGTVTLKSGSGDAKSGGLIGAASGSGTVIERCSSGVDVNASNRKQVGGLMGYLRGVGAWPLSLLVNSYSYGTVTGGGHKQGNLLGDADASRVDRCYSCGYGKALIGYNYRRPVITNCYWDKDKGASSSSRGGTPKSTAQMMQEATFASWDFVEIWNIVENETYPFLRPLVKPIAVALDIKPSNCPNPLNLASNGVLTVAVLGSEEFDVSAIDAVSVELDGTGAIRHSYEDVAGPVVDGNECECTVAGSDGYVDLALKFRTQEVVEELIGRPGELEKDQTLVLSLTGELFDNTGIEGTDCVVLVGNVPKVLAARRWDYNEDGIVNIFDFAAMAEYWLETTDYY
ncbi:MAG: GLUG motif-containing protein [Planctomycetota bacterium]